VGGRQALWEGIGGIPGRCSGDGWVFEGGGGWGGGKLVRIRRERMLPLKKGEV
jgi:hypothetical protein